MPHAAASSSSSQPSLPRYTSQASSLGSPLNPAVMGSNGMRPGSSGGSSSNGAYGGSNPSLVNAGPRYGGNGYGYGAGSQGSAHPLSHALYADSPVSSPRSQQHPPQSPRMQQQRMQSHNGHDEKLGLASFPPAPSSSSSGSSGPRARAARDRAANAGNSAYRRWSGAYIADSGVDARHTKTERQGWLDGLRFLAAWAVVNATFFAAVIPDANVSSSALHQECLLTPTFRCILPFSEVRPSTYSGKWRACLDSALFCECAASAEAHSATAPCCVHHADAVIVPIADPSAWPYPSCSSSWAEHVQHNYGSLHHQRLQRCATCARAALLSVLMIVDSLVRLQVVLRYHFPG